MILRFGRRSKIPEKTIRVMNTPVSYGQPGAHQMSYLERVSVG